MWWFTLPAVSRTSMKWSHTSSKTRPTASLLAAGWLCATLGWLRSSPRSALFSYTHFTQIRLGAEKKTPNLFVFLLIEDWWGLHPGPWPAARSLQLCEWWGFHSWCCQSEAGNYCFFCLFFSTLQLTCQFGIDTIVLKYMWIRNCILPGEKWHLFHIKQSVPFKDVLIIVHTIRQTAALFKPAELFLCN